METRPETTKGPPVLAFICSEGDLIAVDNSVAGTKHYPSVQNNIINTSCHVIGCVTREAADCENICNLLRSLKYPKKKRHSAKKIAMHVAKVLSFDNMEGDFTSMSLDKAAKVVKIGMTMALTESGSESGDSGSEMLVKKIMKLVVL
ncbi:unnamed protein product [Cuscuta campestris]|uniref:Uncharacterized protein n=1 Tax=Cuscuta campestris TaxID=132261 RepID=A0A484NF29_9ASTE|nr:unnamed protein product [Cuscuta campestris]